MVVPVVVLKVPLPELVHVAVVAPPPRVTLRVAVVPLHIAAVGSAVIVGVLGQAQGATETLTEAVAEQLLLSVTVTV